MVVFKKIFKQFISVFIRNLLLVSVIPIASTSAYARTYSSSQIECLAQASYHEAKGEGKKGMLAVIHVTLNRVNDPRFPKSPCSVIAQPNQYSWYRHKPKVKDYETYAVAKQLAKEVVEGKHKDNTGNALFFHARYVTPSWSKKLKCSAVIGQHRFYK